MLDYYTEVAPTLLPYLKDRPITLRVYPQGIRKFSYYRRDLPTGAPSWLRSVDYKPETSEEVIQLPLVDDVDGLIWLANQGGIEVHIWATCAPELKEPDLALIDLDPGDQAPYEKVLEAGMRLREALERLSLRGYPKTSGGQGLHIFLPLGPGHTFDGVREWIKALGEQLAAEYPELIAVAHGPTHLGNLVTVDYAQNSVGRNTAAPYTLRARPGAPVSTPVTWEEVESGQVSPLNWNIHSVPDRVRKLGDLFSEVLSGGQRLPDLKP
jgi:bifunctional non-homologous end joining protein LigD